MSSHTDGARYSRFTWIVAAILVLILLVLWFNGHGPDSSDACCSKPVVTAPGVVPPPVTAKPAGDLKLVYQGGKVVLAGVVADQAMHDSLVQSATTTYGQGNVIDKLHIDAGVAPWSCVAKQDGLFAWLKSGLRSGITCNSDGVILTGVVASDAEKAAREQSARDFFGPDTKIVNNLFVVTPLTAVVKAADVKCGGSIAATVTFASDSAQIDEAGKALLDAIAPCLSDGTYEIGGHTDSSGDDEINLPLSQQRAEAVRDYLVSKGADASKLTAVGYGAERPVADNATEEGKAKNRRIEFDKK